MNAKNEAIRDLIKIVLRDSDIDLFVSATIDRAREAMDDDKPKNKKIKVT